MTRSTIAIALACLGGLLGGCATKESAPAQAAPAAAAEQPSVSVVEVTAASLNVRATPSATGAVLGSLKRGERVRAPQPEANGWLYVEADSGLTGHVASQYVRTVAGAAAPAASSAAPASAPAAAPAARAPAPGSPLSRVTVGMTEAQVIEILGQPTSQQNYVTGKAWIPWYYGSDTSRLDYRYKGVGLVAFSRNRYSGAAKVVRVDADPSEDGLP
jgi:hypothetical protein